MYLQYVYDLYAKDLHTNPVTNGKLTIVHVKYQIPNGKGAYKTKQT